MGMKETVITLYGGAVEVLFKENKETGYHAYFVTDKENGVIKERAKGVTTMIGIVDKSKALVPWAVEEAGKYLLDLIESKKEITPEDIAKSMCQHTERKEEAATIGTKTHEWCEYFIKHKLGAVGYEKEPQLPEDKSMLLGVDSFLEFITQNEVKFISSERIVYSRKHKYIGTMDFEAVINGKLSVGDFKTSNGLYNSVLQQMAAYQAAAEEEAQFIGKPIAYEARYAVRLAKETENEYAERMFKKNAIKQLQGKEVQPIKPYNPFEWMSFIGRESYQCDLEAFLFCLGLYAWNASTDFYTNKK